jgi:hypothetical protein
MLLDMFRTPLCPSPGASYCCTCSLWSSCGVGLVVSSSLVLLSLCDYRLSSCFTNIHLNIILSIDLVLVREIFVSSFPRRPLRTSIPCASSVQSIPLPSLLPSNILRGIPTKKHIITHSFPAYCDLP